MATWLSLITLLMASFSWLPTAAQEATPEDGSTDTELTTQQTTGEQKSLDEGDPPTTSSIQSLSETSTAAMPVSGVTTDACGTKAGFVTGTVSVTDPVAGETITVNLVDEFDIPVKCGGSDSAWMSASYLRAETGTTPPDDSGGDGGGSYGTATVTGTGGLGLRCRTAPVSGAIITVMTEGLTVQLRGPTQNGWAPFECAGQDGHASATYLRINGGTTPPPEEPGDDGDLGGTGKYGTVVNTSGMGLRCRTAPVSGNVIGVIPEGGRVETRGSLTNGWYPVTCFGQAGWVSAVYVMGDVAGGGSGEFWIDTNLSTQYMRVYRGSTVINGTYVSTGRPRFATPPGTFYIIRKLPSQIMSGVLGGEYYYVPNVPWVMYFTNRSHAIHGAYWHNNFGSVMSHGCVNLPVSFAQWLYYNTPMYTRVNIHY